MDDTPEKKSGIEKAGRLASKIFSKAKDAVGEEWNKAGKKVAETNERRAERLESREQGLFDNDQQEALNEPAIAVDTEFIDEVFQLYALFTNPMNKDRLLDEFKWSFEGEDVDKHNLDKTYFSKVFLNQTSDYIEHFKKQASHVLYDLWNGGAINLVEDFEHWESSFRYFFKGDLEQFSISDKSQSFFNQEGIAKIRTQGEEKLRQLNERIDYEALEVLREQATDAGKTVVGAVGKFASDKMEEARLERERLRQEEIAREEARLAEIARASKEDEERIVRKEEERVKKAAKKAAAIEAERLEFYNDMTKDMASVFEEVKGKNLLVPFIKHFDNLSENFLSKSFPLEDCSDIIFYKISKDFNIKKLLKFAKWFNLTVAHFTGEGGLDFERDEVQKNEIDLFFANRMHALTAVYTIDRDRKIIIAVSRGLSSFSQQEIGALKLYYYLAKLRPSSMDNYSINNELFGLIYNKGNCDLTFPNELNKKEFLENDISRGACIQAMGQIFKNLSVTEYEAKITDAISRVKNLAQVRTYGEELVRNHLLGLANPSAAKFFKQSDLNNSKAFTSSRDNGYFLGTLDGSNMPIYYKGDGSLITVGAPESGKTQCHAIQNLIDHQGSAIVLDIKGELYKYTAEERAKKSKVFRFSPADVRNSAAYNPLEFISDDKYYFEDDCHTIAQGIIPIQDDDKESYWRKDARKILTAFIAISVEFEHDLSVEFQGKSITSVSRMVSAGSAELATLILIMKSSKYTMVQSAGRTIKNLLKGYGNEGTGGAEKQFLGVIGELETHLMAWQSTLITEITGRSDWSPLTLKTEPTTIYLCIPMEKIKPHAPILRLMLSQHIDKLMQGETESDHDKVLLMLDEFAQLGKMPPISNAITAGRGYGIKTWLMCQSMSQLKEFYGENGAQTILNSCGVENWMRVSQNDAHMLVKRLGSERQIFSDKKEDVLDVDDLTGEKFRDHILTFATGEKALKLKKKFYFERAENS